MACMFQKKLFQYCYGYISGKIQIFLEKYVRDIYYFITRFSPAKAEERLDYKVSDLKRQLNKLKSKTKSKENYLNLLVAEIRKSDAGFSNKVSKKDLGNSHYHLELFNEFDFLKVFTIPEEEQRQRYLENEIHKISLKMM